MKGTKPTSRAIPEPTRIKHGTGIVRGNPARCFKCGTRVKPGEGWSKQTSPDGAYRIIIHDRCNGKG